MSLKNQTTTGIIWTFSQQFGNQIIGFVVSLVLARLLLPAEFGLIGMIAVFVSIGRVIIESGLTESLIRNKEVDQEDLTTVFYSNVVFSILLYAIIYFAAPFIAEFYDQPILVGLVRLYCLTFLLSAFYGVQLARLSKQMNFKTQAMVAVPANLLGGVVGISMAYAGYGVWSLAWNYLASAILKALLLAIFVRWKPSFSFSVEKFKYHFNFGYKITLSGLLDKIFKNLYYLVIGKYFSAAQLGFYTRAETLKNLPVAVLSTALNKVTYPMFSSIQEDNVRLKRVYQKLLKMVVFVVAPMLIIMAVLAEPTIRFLFTEKWLPAVPYFQILCITGIMRPVHYYNLNVLKVKGRSDLVLKVTIAKRALTVVGIIIGLQFGIYGILYAQVVLSFVFFIINAHYTNDFISYSAWEQSRDILPILFWAITGGVVAFVIDQFWLEDMHDLIRIFGGILAVIWYGGLSYLFKFESALELKNLIQEKIEANKKKK